MSGDTKSRLGGIGNVTKSGRDALDAAEFVVTDTLFCLRGSSRKRQSVTARQGRAPHRFHSLGFAASCVRITAYVNQHLFTQIRCFLAIRDSTLLCGSRVCKRHYCLAGR